MAKHQVRALLMGGQACVFYGAAEFSRDTDLAVLAEKENLELLQAAFQELQAAQIAVPPFELEYLQRGHAIHFRCQHPEAAGMRVDVLSVMRGVDTFGNMWGRRVTLGEPVGDARYELLSLPDLVQTKKTQREKDWPMLRRLLEADYLAERANASPERVRFWLREMRTPELLVELGQKHPELLDELTKTRPLLDYIKSGNMNALAEALEIEEKMERERDRTYWQPLKAELEKLRHNRK